MKRKELKISKDEDKNYSSRNILSKTGLKKEEKI
jgi:hypothetical protein